MIVLAGFPQWAHEIPAHGLADAPAVALEPVRHRVELAHDLALPAGLLTHLAQRRIGGGLARVERALGQRPHGLVAQIARADQQNAARVVDDETAGGEL